MENKSFLKLLLQAKQKRDVMPQMLLDAFCRECWISRRNWNLSEDRKLWEDCFTEFGDVLKSLPADEKMRIIPQLVSKSKIWPSFMFLARELFDQLSPEEQKSLEIPVVRWTRNDKERIISQEEFLWLKANGFRCWENKEHPGIYLRPARFEDFECFYKLLSMIQDSETEAYMYFPGDE